MCQNEVVCGREICLATLDEFSCVRIWIMVDRHSRANRLTRGKGTRGGASQRYMDARRTLRPCRPDAGGRRPRWQPRRSTWCPRVRTWVMDVCVGVDERGAGGGGGRVG